MTEKELQTAVIDACKLFGWAHYHTFNSRRSVAGFPDLVLVRDRIIFVELKSENGRLTLEQQAWGDAIRDAGGNWLLIRPSDLDNLIEILR